MNQIQFPLGLCFDDILLVPKRFDHQSRDNISLATTIAGMKLELPIISANMPSVTETQMSVELGKLGGLGIIHRMQSVFEQTKMITEVVKTGVKVGGAIGIGNDAKERAEALVDAGVNVICIDVAHGDQLKVLEVAMSFKREFGDFPLIIGNFATSDSVRGFHKTLIDEGFQKVAYKLGVGSGAMCTTRVKTGCGVPTLASILDVVQLKTTWPDLDIIADGGIKNSGDIVKSLAAGANTCMLGNLISGTDECPGVVIKDKQGRMCKVYRGAASYAEKRDFFGKSEYIEGEETLVDYKGPVKKVVQRICEGIKSGFSYCGSVNLKELQRKAEFIKISPAGHRESLPHGV